MKLLSKRNIIIAVSVLVVAVAVGLVISSAPQPEPEQPLYATELTEQKRAELIQSLQNKYGKGYPELIPGNTMRIAKNDTSYYYGTYNGYDVIFIKGDTTNMWSLKLGDVVFNSTSGARMYLHRNGEFIDLKIAYQQGLISDADVKTAWEIHNSI